jgi:hypothetical protein
VARYLDLFGSLRDLGTPLLLATSVIGACRLLGPLPEFSAAIGETRALLAGLGAVPFLDRLEEAVAERAEAPIA